MKDYDTEDVIYAQATAWGNGAIAVIRVSGDGCLAMLSPSVRMKKPLESLKSGSAVFGHFYDAEKGELLDDCIFTVFRNGHGYTGEESAELSCHGGQETVRGILSYLGKIGMRCANRGEFTFRAFLHGKMDLTQAEAVNELIRSRGECGKAFALNRLNGALSRRISDVRDSVLSILGSVEVQLDYADDEIGEDIPFPFDALESAKSSLQKVLDTYSVGKLYSQGARVVLYGAVNAGKSSLFNMFLREDRAIVSPQAGTTRDYIECSCEIDGIPVRLFDTAGIRKADDDIEAEGVRRSESLVQSADLVVYVADGSDDSSLPNVQDDGMLCVLNKSDLKQREVEGFLNVSAITGEGFEKLCSEIGRRLRVSCPENSDDGLIIENERQRDNILRAVSSMDEAEKSVRSGLGLDITAMYLQECLECLGEITGSVTTDDILDRIFSDFCVGK